MREHYLVPILSTMIPIVIAPNISPPPRAAMAIILSMNFPLSVVVVVDIMIGTRSPV